MARKADEKRWESKFARFVNRFGVAELAAELGVNPSAIYHWIAGSTDPNIANAMTIRELAKGFGVRLSLDDIYRREARG